MDIPTCRLCRTAAIAVWVFCAFPALTACTGAPSNPPPEKAFALSASALSGSDRYGFDGQVSIYDPNGVIAEQSRYTGEVTGHGNLNLQWSGGQTLRTGASPGPGAFNPMQLLKAVQSRSAQVTYAGPPDTLDTAGDVQLRVALTEPAARARIAEGLRVQMAQLRSETGSRRLNAAGQAQADRILSRANGNLEAALSTLRVQTVCLWTADRRTWFPRRMTEQTELAYSWQGKPYREKRSSVTNFLPAGRNGTMVKNSSSNP